MNDVKKVLLLGGSQHLGVGYVGTNFGTPISQCNGVDLPEQYHRAVFNPVVVDDRAAGAWYVYVTDSYQMQPAEFSESQLLDKLKQLGIAAHMVGFDPQVVPKGRFLKTT